MGVATLVSRLMTLKGHFQWVCDIQIIWKLSHMNLLRIIVYELFEPWPMLIVFLFLVLILSIWLIIKANNWRKCYSPISKKQISIFAEGVLQIQSFSSVHLSIYWFPCDTFSSGSTDWVFLIFCMRIFCHIY